MNVSYFLGKQFFRASYKFYFHCRVVEPEHVPNQGPAILASNHASFLDPPLLGIGLQRDVTFMTRESLFRFPLIREILLSWNAIPVDRDGGGGRGLKAVLERLNKGEAVLLFPEGTRTRDGRLQPARSGIGLAVIKSDAPVVPARVFGTYEAYGRHCLVPRPLPIMAKYAPPLMFESLREEARQCSKVRLKEIYREVADQIMAAISRIEPYEKKSSFP